jgi:hypothetical protein
MSLYSADAGYSVHDVLSSALQPDLGTSTQACMNGAISVRSGLRT